MEQFAFAVDGYGITCQVEGAAVAVHAVAKAGALSGRNVAVLGAGPIGNLVAQVARAEGANVLITDLSDYRLQIARQCGVPATANPVSDPLTDAARGAFGENGFDVAFECAGVEATIRDAVETIQKGGTVVIVGVFGDRPRVDLGLVQDRELTLCGTLMYQRCDYERAVELIAQAEVSTDPLLSTHFSLDDYPRAYRYIDEHGEGVMKVVIDV